MKKEKRLSIILTVIQQNQFNKKQQIVDYMAKHFGVYYSLTTISRDLQENKSNKSIKCKKTIRNI